MNDLTHDYKIVRVDGSILARAASARKIRAKLRPHRNTTKIYTILDCEGGVITRVQLEELCLAEECAHFRGAH